ncbi:hypothetical protein BJX65DRAFT_116489 [Aspergillus insuetus]
MRDCSSRRAAHGPTAASGPNQLASMESPPQTVSSKPLTRVRGVHSLPYRTNSGVRRTRPSQRQRMGTFSTWSLTKPEKRKGALKYSRYPTGDSKYGVSAEEVRTIRYVRTVPSKTSSVLIPNLKNEE